MTGIVQWSVGVVGGGSGSNNTNVADVCAWIQRVLQLVMQGPYITVAVNNDHSAQASVIVRYDINGSFPDTSRNVDCPALSIHIDVWN